jgi:hypothetical protein
VRQLHMADRYRGAASDDRRKLLRPVIGIANQGKHCDPGSLTLASRAFLECAVLLVVGGWWRVVECSCLAGHVMSNWDLSVSQEHNSTQCLEPMRPCPPIEPIGYCVARCTCAKVSGEKWTGPGTVMGSAGSRSNMASSVPTVTVPLPQPPPPLRASRS